MALSDFGLTTRYVKIVKEPIYAGAAQYAPAGSLPLDEIILHRCDSFSTTVGGQASSFRTVKGREVSDHVTASARVISIDGAFTDTPGLMLGGVSALKDGVQSLFFPRMPATRHLKRLEEWKEEGASIRIVTASRTYYDLVIVSISRTDDQPRAEVKVSIQLQEIRTVDSITAPAEMDPEVRALEDAGQVSLQEFSPGSLIDSGLPSSGINPGLVLP